jgi:hypothetical protein
MALGYLAIGGSHILTLFTSARHRNEDVEVACDKDFFDAGFALDNALAGHRRIVQRYSG